MPVKRLIALGAALFVLFVLLGLPAAALWRHVASEAPGLELAGVSGTVWRGRADQLVWQHAPLGELYWQWQPAWPPSWRVDVQGPLLTLNATVSSGGSDELSLHAVSARWSAWLMRSPLPGATLDGDFEAQLDELLWLGQQPQRIQGVLHWRNARLVTPIAVELGQLRIDITTRGPGQLELAVHTVAGGALQVNGKGQVSAGRYQLNLHLRARQLHSNISQWLTQLGEPTGDGGVRVQLTGDLRAGATS